MCPASSQFVCYLYLPLIKLLSSPAVQLLEDKPFNVFKPVVEKLIIDKDQNKQRAAAELLAGVLGGMMQYLSETELLMSVNVGSKHWPAKKQESLWAWFTPHMKNVFSQNIKTDTLSIWSSFVEVRLIYSFPRFTKTEDPWHSTCSIIAIHEEYSL